MAGQASGGPEHPSYAPTAKVSRCVSLRVWCQPLHTLSAHTHLSMKKVLQRRNFSLGGYSANCKSKQLVNA